MCGAIAPTGSGVASCRLVQYDLAGPPAYTLPEHVTCRQGHEAPAEAVCRITPADGGPAVDHRLLLVPYDR